MRSFLFSGIEKQATAKVLSDLSASGMMSQFSYSPRLMEACSAIQDLAIDSGAYTKELLRIDIEKYARLIIKMGDRCVWYANADKIGDQKRSNENYTFLLSLLPPELHARILWIYQYGADKKYLHEGLEQHERVGLGGLVPLFQAHDKTLAKYTVLSLAETVKEYNRFPHFFGLSIFKIIQELNLVLEDYSLDSTTWLAGGRYGLLVNNVGKQRPASQGGYDWDTEALLRQNVRTMRKWVEGCQIKKPAFSPYIQLALDALVSR